MNNIKRMSIICLFMLVLAPVLVSAVGPALEPVTGAGSSSNKPLVTCGKDVTGKESDACGIEDVNVLLKSILNLVFMFAGFVVAAMFMYAGFLLITAAGNTGQIQKAKDIFKRVVIGFLIMFLSFILVKNLLTNVQAVQFFTKIFQ